jgi:hypothetical protein
MSVIWPESPKGCLLLGESPLMTLLFWIKNHALGWYSQRVWQKNLLHLLCEMVLNLTEQITKGLLHLLCELVLNLSAEITKAFIHIISIQFFLW